MSCVTQVKSYLHDKFKIKDLGQLKYFLGLEIAHSIVGIFVSQCKYALEVLEDIGYLGCKLALFPTDSKLKLTKSDVNLLEDPS